VLAEVACLVGSEDPKLHFIKVFWRGCLPLEEAWFPCIVQNKFSRNLISLNPLPPYLKLIRIPETSGSDGASSEHPDFSLH